MTFKEGQRLKWTTGEHPYKYTKEWRDFIEIHDPYFTVIEDDGGYYITVVPSVRWKNIDFVRVERERLALFEMFDFSIPQEVFKL